MALLMVIATLVASTGCEQTDSKSKDTEPTDAVGEISGISGTGVTSTDDLDPALVERFASLALDCVEREYPNKIGHVLHSDADVRPPRELTPAFAGCFDWHSAVHGHWLLVRLARLYPEVADTSTGA